MPKYEKFMKDLLTNKEKYEETSKVTLNERCSTTLINEIPLNEKDPGSFTIPCAIGKIDTDKALADLGASIRLMPYLMFVRLELSQLKTTRMGIELENKLTQYPKGIAENVIVKIDKFVFNVNFVVLDIEEDVKVPIILARPFLATSHAMIDVFNKKISFEETLPRDQLDSFLFEPIKNYQPRKDINLWEDENEITMDEPDGFNNPKFFAASTTDKDKQIPKLKELPSHLEYAFLYVMSKTIVYTDHSALKYLFSKHDAKMRLIRLENAELEELNEEAIRDSFPDEHLMDIHVKEPKKDPCIEGRLKDITGMTLPQGKYLNPDSTGQLSSRMPQDMFGNVMHIRELETSLLLQRATSDIFKLKTSSRKSRLLEDILVSWDGYQLICRGNTLKVLKIVRGGNTLMIVLLFEDKQAELKEEPAVGKADARSGQWVETTMKKVQQLILMTDSDERKHVLDYTYVELYRVEDQRKNLLCKFNSFKQELSSCKSKLLDLKDTKVHNISLQHEISRLNLENESLRDELYGLKKAEESPSETICEITSDSESECDNQEPLPPLPRLSGTKPIGTSTNVIPPSDLNQTSSFSNNTKKVTDKESSAKIIKKKAQTKSPSIPNPDEREDCYNKSKCSTCKSTNHLTKEHPEQVVVKNTLAKLNVQSSEVSSLRKAPKTPRPFIPCKYCGFNDHHSDECEYYPGCDICRSIAYEPSDSCRLFLLLRKDLR
ncbi:retrovirus-related pol polyprotein from transposon TNT 1-94 [Tanacetum coccineum]